MDLLAPQSWGAWLYIIGLTTGSRIGEPIAARKEWYDPLGFIRVPAEFTKMKKPHVIPIIELIRPSWRPMYPSSHPAITYSMRRDPRTQI
jgi:integrase